MGKAESRNLISVFCFLFSALFFISVLSLKPEAGKMPNPNDE
jgi:hypothetical protein